jgi:HlyD family secretion protein
MAIIDSLKADIARVSETFRALVNEFLMVNAPDGTLTATNAALWTGAIIAAAVFSVLLTVFFRSAPKQIIGRPLHLQTRGARWMGYFVATVFFGFLGGWAWYAPLSSAAVAPGVVSPDGSRKTVQHLEGGIIRSIHVREGQHVEAGATLITLEDVRALARLDELREQMIFLLATEGRLLAELDGREVVAFVIPEDLRQAAAAQVEIAQRGQQQLFESRRDMQTARKRILAKRVDQLNEEITGDRRAEPATGAHWART